MQRTIRRRELLTAFAGAIAAFSQWSIATDRQAKSDLRINGQRLRRTLEELSRFGRPAGGSFADGVSRVAYSAADIAGRAYVMSLMRAAMLEPKIDCAGNIIARREGSERGMKPIVFGSHIDSVPGGGNFDGDLGSLGAIEIMTTLQERHIKTRHPLELAIWSNEEGGLIGSRGEVGELPAAALDREFNGIRMLDGLRGLGGDPTCMEQSHRAPKSIECYLELHIEQGGLLEKAGIPIGVVDGIVSIDEYAVEIQGVANHAGTTPMPERRNALLAAAQLIEAVQE
jgi:beta-ureidopropionase / N-carbamoyl-L-amino-acid hydrolase